MKRSFWTILLLLMVSSGGWAVYVGAQEFQGLVAEAPTDEAQDQLRYQFTDHFFVQNGREFEILLRLDRLTGETWRFHASQGAWTPIAEPSNGTRPVSSREQRYELMSHIYRDQNGVRHELFLRVDYVDGHSWSYRGMAGTWKNIVVEPGTDTGQTAAEATPQQPQKDGEGF